MIRVLILEDNPSVIEIILMGLRELGFEKGKIMTTTISSGAEAMAFSYKEEIKKFDIIFLDYISADNINFHQAVLHRVKVQKVIAISNTVTYNKMAEERGVSRTVQKKYSDLAGFKEKLKKEIKELLN